jgi:proteic killer suppression protein
MRPGEAVSLQRIESVVGLQRDSVAAIDGRISDRSEGAVAGRYSIRINDQWRIVFRWTSVGPEEVEIRDYH